MTPNEKLVVFAAVSVAVYLVAVVALARLTRPKLPTAAPPTPDLGTEPPAVVNLLVNAGRPTDDAARATLLDLAARRILEVYQPVDDPLRPSIRVRQASPVGLRPYERRVFDRLRDATPDNHFVPLATVANAYAREGWLWWGSFRREVRRDARTSGFTDSWFSWGTAVLLLAAAFVAMAVASLVFIPMDHGSGSSLATLPFTAVCSVVLLALVLYLFHVHDFDGYTPLGRATTAHWLGVTAWLRAHEDYGATPAAGVAVWDRYLSYGVALGANPVAAAAVDLRTGRTERAWSRHGGRLRPVTVVHPWQFANFGTPASTTLAWAVVAVPIWVAIGGVCWAFVPPYTNLVLDAFVAWRLLRNLYLGGRAVADRAAPVTVTGTLLSIRPNNPDAPPEDDIPEVISALRKLRRVSPRRLMRVVVDDGRSDHLRPWLVQARNAVGVQPGQAVALVGERFGRYARSVVAA